MKLKDSPATVQSDMNRKLYGRHKEFVGVDMCGYGAVDGNFYNFGTYGYWWSGAFVCGAVCEELG